MSSGRPKVSVVIPCFNSTPWLRETVECVLSQSLRELELVLVDDGSEDETRVLCQRLVAEYAERDLLLIYQPNAGLASARNRGISVAQGEYILPLDADDLLAPTMLEECAAVLDASPELSIVYTDRQDFGDVERVWSAGLFDLAHLKFFNQLPYCSLYRRALWNTIGGYRCNVSGFDDWDFWIAAALRNAKARHLPLPLFRHRRRQGSQMWRLIDRYEALHAAIILNNHEAYSEEEFEKARRFLFDGDDFAMLRAARFIFLSNFLPSGAEPSRSS
jgi:glycosyltransferase involved in cell wall biosynthesis